MFVVCMCVRVCARERACGSSKWHFGDPDRSPTRAGFHHDEVTLVLLVLNSLSNYIQSYAHIIPAAGFVRNCAYICVYVCVYVCVCI